MNTTANPRLERAFADIEAHVARYPDPRPPVTHTPAPAPSLVLLYAAQDEVVEYSAMQPMRAPKPSDQDDVFSQEDDYEDAARRAVSDKHFGIAVCELFEAMTNRRGDWAPTARESAVMDFMERVEARALDLAADEAGKA